MKEYIKITDCAGVINRELKRGIMLNTNGEKFNSMTIGWGALGTIWNKNAFTVYVRGSRYTKPQLDKTQEFTLSIPLGERDPVIERVLGSLSGYDVDKVKEAGLELEPPNTTTVPGFVQYPLTIECHVVYSQELSLGSIPKHVLERFYPNDTDAFARAERGDPHTMYIGDIVDSYIIKK